jgi:hypothetical protein
VKGQGNQQDYGMRIYDPRLGRFLSVDPLTKSYPELTPYQFASNSPIVNIDLDGLEGLQYMEIVKMKDGSTTTKRIVELDLHAATSETSNRSHFKSTDLSRIETNLEREYNNGFIDAGGNTVEFRFNMKSFDADKISSEDYAKNLLKDRNNYDVPIDPISTLAQKSSVIVRKRISGEGRTFGNLTKIHPNADESHTIAHEILHVFLNYDPSANPQSNKEHENAGGVLKYKVVDEKGNVISPTLPVNQNNVNLILKSVPEVKSKTIDER